MAKRSSQTFAKRQKEIARKERQQEKAQKRLERKLRRAELGHVEVPIVSQSELFEDAEPVPEPTPEP